MTNEHELQDGAESPSRDSVTVSPSELVSRILTLVDTIDVDSEYVLRNLFIEIGRDQLDRGYVLNDLIREIHSNG